MLGAHKATAGLSRRGLASEEATTNKRRRSHWPTARPTPQAPSGVPKITLPLAPQLEHLQVGSFLDEARLPSDNEEIWADQSFFSVGFPFLERPEEASLDSSSFDWPFLAASEEDRQAWHHDMGAIAWASPDLDRQVAAIADILFPDLPTAVSRQVNLGLQNPFAEGSIGRYDKPRDTVKTAKQGEVNGYIKFRLQNTDAGFNDIAPGPRPFGLVHHGRKRPRTVPWQSSDAVVPLLPPDFGRGLKLDANDQKLLKFYVTAYCQGRTLIPRHNFWLTEIASMAETEPVVQEALLAYSGAYVLDYLQSESLRKRTSGHYAKASDLISKALARAECHEMDKSEALVAAIILMEADDEVFYELRRPKEDIPNFYRGNLLAKALLDHSDPGYRYWKARNVQYTRAWAGMSACVAVGCILPEMVSPLVLLPPAQRQRDRNFGWLLGGTKREAHTIYGAKGFSPKLIHVLAQITRLCAEMHETPDSVVLPMAASRLQQKLDAFRQRSELSEGHATAAALFDACGSDGLDEHGKVSTPVRVTELSGEAWLCTAKIYLHCRFFRKPPSHLDVRRTLQDLSRCIQLLPQEGPLLTAQSPFFPVFLMAVMSFTAADRAVAREWFQGVVSGGGRSNVPPVWDAVQLLWEWLDAHVFGPLAPPFDNEAAIGQRHAWWEDMVEYLSGQVGWMSLT